MKKQKETATRNETARNELGTDLSDWFCALQFAGMLTCMDEGIGNVTSALESKTMLENMFIIFTTDNVRALDQRLLLLHSMHSCPVLKSKRGCKDCVECRAGRTSA